MPRTGGSSGQRAEHEPWSSRRGGQEEQVARVEDRRERDNAAAPEELIGEEVLLEGPRKSVRRDADELVRVAQLFGIVTLSSRGRTAAAKADAMF